MSAYRIATVTAALALASFALAACGSDDNGGEEDAITGALERATTSGDPASCTEDQTTAFVVQTAGDLKSCQANAAQTPGDSVEVSNIEVDGDSATADVAFTGGTLDGQTLAIDLAKEDDAWKLDSLNGFTEFNKEAMVATFLEQLRSDMSTPQQVITCVEGELNKAQDADLQSFILAPDGGTAAQVLGACFQQ